VLVYGCESWTIKAKDKARLISAEMKFMRRTACFIWSDFKQNIEILEELKVNPIQDKISNYKTDWRDHVNQMSRSRLPKLIMQYTPKGRKDRGRPMTKMTHGF
jgi:Tfp pilus assembly protein PilZ